MSMLLLKLYYGSQKTSRVKENTQKNIYFIVKVFKIMIRLIWLY